MTDNVLDAISNELLRNRNALLRVRHVVTEGQLDLFAIDATSGIDVGSSLLGTLLQLSAESGVRAGQRTGNADRGCQPRQRRDTAIMAARARPDIRIFFISQLPVCV